MRVISVVSTKGGLSKTTVAANLGGLLADAGLRVLLLDLDSQPTLSSYYALSQKAVAGAYEFIALNLTAPAQIISRTVIAELDLIISNDDQGRLSTLLLHPLRLLLNQVKSIRMDTRMIIRSLHETFVEATNISVLDTVVPDRVAYLNAASLGLPVHRIETRRSRKRRSSSALETMQALAIELFPEWREAISTVTRCAEVQ
ncbi:ParA family protein [Pseudomonas fluorescens]|uniref:CobQ/CobB/MinD/ParA nucleotide binding domain-containing protein n=1 Tax=Pseudomonas fluorescens TaxID=294 RepID=A0A423LFW8_PSEFL|nr:ParA family protein [Pseudomonas fluorescens]RON67212.1 hypothetical protein BK671_14645 [Pseudomonas fluorescens]